MVKQIVRSLIVSGFLLVLLPQVASAAKVNFSPASVSLTEGQSRVVTVTLDEPIICSDPDIVCQVSLAISTNAPDRVTIDTSPVVFASNQWFQSLTFTVTAVDDSLDNGDITPVVTIINTSGSEYYNGFTPTFSISILDNDVAAPVVEEAATSSQPTLAATGHNQYDYLLFAVVSLVILIIPLRYLISF